MILLDFELCQRFLDIFQCFRPDFEDSKKIWAQYGQIEYTKTECCQRMEKINAGNRRKQQAASEYTKSQ
jgi:hypothetical protein